MRYIISFLSGLACHQEMRVGGQTGIRTLETVSRLHTFQACAFDHSATCPVVQRLAPTGTRLQDPLRHVYAHLLYPARHRRILPRKPLKVCYDPATLRLQLPPETQSR